MGFSFSNDTIEKLKNQIDIVDIIGRSVSLKKKGANYKGLCPFHGEKTPSFVVSRDKQIFTCFGCGASGDAIGIGCYELGPRAVLQPVPCVGDLGVIDDRATP